jgi:hypothetical protein
MKSSTFLPQIDQISNSRPTPYGSKFLSIRAYRPNTSVENRKPGLFFRHHNVDLAPLHLPRKFPDLDEIKNDLIVSEKLKCREFPWKYPTRDSRTQSATCQRPNGQQQPKSDDEGGTCPGPKLPGHYHLQCPHSDQHTSFTSSAAARRRGAALGSMPEPLRWAKIRWHKPHRAAPPPIFPLLPCRISLPGLC